MSNPPHPSRGESTDPPADQPAWGKPPPGGWGQQPPQDGQQGWDPDETRDVDPRTRNQPGGPPPAWGSAPQPGSPQAGAPQPGGQQPGAPQYGQPGFPPPGAAQPGFPPGGPPPYGAQQYGPGQYGPPQQGGPQVGGPPQYGGPPGPPPYGPPPGGPQYGGPQHAGPPYGGPQHGGPQYGGPQYGGPPPGGPPQYGAPQYGGPPQGGPPRDGAPQGLLSPDAQPDAAPQGAPRHGAPPADGSAFANGQQPNQPWSAAPPTWGQPDQQEWSRQGQPTSQWAPDSDPQSLPPYPSLPDAPPRAGKSRLPLILGLIGALLVLAAVGVLGFVTPGYFLVRVFDPVAVQNGVQGVLTNDYGIAGVDRVICTDGNKVTVGTTFDCKATVNGQPVTVTVRVTSNEGNYEVERPPAT